MDLKPEPESEQGFRGQEVFVAGTGSSVDLVSKLVLSFPGMPAEEDFEAVAEVSFHHCVDWRVYQLQPVTRLRGL